MILYHFTPRHLVDSILCEGLRLGGIPTQRDSGELDVVWGFQWLTTNPDFCQSWCEHSTLPYDRAAVRLTIRVPDLRRKRLLRHGYRSAA